MNESKPEKQPVEREPSVLDYVKAKLMPWTGPAPQIPPAPLEEPTATWPGEGEDQPPEVEPFHLTDLMAAGLPWRVLGVLAFGLAGQLLLLPSIRNGWLGAGFYLAAVMLAIWAMVEGELTLATAPEDEHAPDTFTVALWPLVAGLAVSMVAFFAFSGNKYTELNVFLWLVGLGLLVWAFWLPLPDVRAWLAKALAFLRQTEWTPRITRFTLLFILVLGIGIFFRAYRIGGVVPDMVSDHAEKLLDVYDALHGETRIFFPHNTGREGLQFYLIAATSKLFGTGLSFLSMKIGTILMGIFMLPYMYLLGKELGNKQVGLLAMFFSGIAFWPNALARVALRFILYPAFTAPALYYLLRGLKTGRRGYFIASGIFLGIGLHGYSPFRIVPVMLALVVLLYWLHNRTKENLVRAVVWLGIVAFIALIVFLPLLRVWVEMPFVFTYRAMTRLTPLERGAEMASGWALWSVLFSNIWNGLLMLNWDSGTTWVATITNYPSLDIVSGMLFVVGAGLMFYRYLRQRRWQDLTLLLAVPVLMLPGTLAIAFPEENPSPHRAGGAAVAVFLIVAFALEAILRALREKTGGKFGLRLAWVAMLGLGLIAIRDNYSMTFETYAEQNRLLEWNTAEIGAIIREFTTTIGAPDQAWVVAYPYWVDTRLVGINAGYPTKDYAIWPADLASTLDTPAPKLFIFKPDDVEAMSGLLALYPDGSMALHEAQIPDKSFFIYYVP